MKEDASIGYTIQQNDESHCWLFLLVVGYVIAEKQDADNVQYALQLSAFLSIYLCICMGPVIWSCKFFLGLQRPFFAQHRHFITN